MSFSSSSLTNILPAGLRSLDEYQEFYNTTKKNLEAIYEAKIEDGFTHGARVFNIENLQSDCALKANEIFKCLETADEAQNHLLKAFKELACQLTQLASDTHTILNYFHYGQLLKTEPIKGQEPIFVQCNPNNLAVPLLTQAHYLRRFLLLKLKVEAATTSAETRTEYENATQELQSTQLTAANLLATAKKSGLTEASEVGEKCAKFLSKKVPEKMKLLTLYFHNRTKNQSVPQPQDSLPKTASHEEKANTNKMF